MRSPLPRWSIETRLPIVVGALFLVVLSAFAVAAYQEVDNALTNVAEARLLSASSQLGAALEASPPTQMAELEVLGLRPELLAFVRDPAAGSAEARAILDSAAAAGTGRAALVARASDGTMLVAGDSAALGFIRDAAPFGVGPFATLGDTVGYALTWPVVAEGDTLGTITDARVLTGSAQAVRLISDLIGPDASFRLGNRSGDVWTDLAGVVPGRGVPAVTGAMVPFERPDGVDALGIAQPIAGTPWIQWVDLPASAVSGPLAAFAGRMALLAALLVSGGALGAWLLGRRITRPLARLTSAAESVAAGDYSRRISSERHDEIGRLGDAFDVMAEEVAEAQHRLEDRVAERTAELREALADLEEAQEELVRKERLALLGELAGGVGHELRNPLGVMTNAVFYLEAVMRDRPAEVDEYLGILRKQIGTAEKIVGDLLDFARVKPPQRSATALPALVEEQVRRAMPPAGVDVREDFPPDLPPADVDAGQVGQVVLNLITNAIQAMDEGGVLTLRGRSENGSVRLEVEDTGKGIDEPTLQKIFEPLFTTRAKGIGLGLSVSRSLAEANGGTLDARSTPGEGATFVLSLPAPAASS